jgi:hypothetical protein
MLWVEPYSIPLCQTKERKKETKEGKRETKRKSLRPKFNKKQKALRDRSTHRCTHCCLTVQQQNKKVSRKTTPEELKKQITTWLNLQHSTRHEHHKE